MFRCCSAGVKASRQLALQTCNMTFFVSSYDSTSWLDIALVTELQWNATKRVSSLYENINYNDLIMGIMASQITSLTIVYSTVYSGADQRKHQSSASLAFVRGIHRWPAKSPHKWPVTRKMFPFDDVIMSVLLRCSKFRKNWAYVYRR